MRTQSRPPRLSRNTASPLLEPPGGVWVGGEFEAGSAGCCPADPVPQYSANVGMVVNGIFLVAGGEIEQFAQSPSIGDAAAEDLTAGERADEDELVGGGDVEELPVHFLLRDDHRIRNAL